ncbi:putative cyclin [Lupinus albus]|uniref:B-like cyclin n=1 Tax=Lupinus albus TaxID=3870 RepID=A0A6A4P5H6_LUPAL|nr:putative cyclin [Lupinus albus]
MEEGTHVTLSLLLFEHRKICFGDFECNALFEHNIELSDESVGLMVQKEEEHLPKDDYFKNLHDGHFNLSVRKQALDWMLKAHAYLGFGPWTIFLSVNYLDRFLSLFELPRNRNWISQLVAVACLSIAAKIGETKVPLSTRLQVGPPKFVFEAITIQTMELLVLSTLEWKMQALTPCSFIDYFISKINCEQHQMKSCLLKSYELMLSITKSNAGIDFLEFKSSEIAAAVAISVTRELEAKEIHKALSSLVMVKEERVLKCLEVMRDLSLVKISGNLTPFVSESPVCVLDGACTSSKTDKLTIGSSSNSSNLTPNTEKQSNAPLSHEIL